MKLKVTNTETGKVWIKNNTSHVWHELALEIVKSNEHSRLVYCDIEGLVELNDQWYILDECGNWEYVSDKYKIEEMNQEKV